ncbi:MAG: DUF5675 family protein [Rikenellaceae bacterium]
MILKLKRIAFEKEYTIGKLYGDGVYLCDTLENRVREDGIKVYGSTAIPKGEYKLIWNLSQRFKRNLPLLIDVPNFSGVRIHCGNTCNDTLGCVLVGENKSKGSVSNSRKTFARIEDILKIATKIIIS